jgi:hypothetical protein
MFKNSRRDTTNQCYQKADYGLSLTAGTFSQKY